MRPHLADVTGDSDRYATAADRLADAIFECEAVEGISRGTRIDVVSKAWARLPGPLNGRERPHNQVVLQGEGGNRLIRSHERRSRLNCN